MTYTPGPWTTKGRAYKDSNFGGYSCRVIGPRDGDAFPSVAKAYGGINDEREVAEANARLIAAAPKLLDVLSRIVRAHDSGNNGAVMGEATLCKYFARMAHDVIDEATSTSVEVGAQRTKGA
jgi:hypothetical protein